VKRLLLVVLLIGSATASAQVADERLTLSVSTVQSIVGATRTRVIGDYIVFEGPGRIGSIGTVLAKTAINDVQFLVTNIKTFEPTPYSGPFKVDGGVAIVVDREGRHRVEVDAIDWDKKQRVRAVNVVVVGPRPPPTPDDDDPKPPAPDQEPPIDGDGLRVLIVYESSELNRLTADQRDIFYGQTVRKYLTANCVQQDRYSEWRILDQDTSFVDAGSRWVKALARPRTSLPWILISNGKTGYEGPLPATASETIELVKRFKE